MSSEDYRRVQENARQLQSILARLEALERGAGLRNSAIGAGGMRVKGGGSIYLQDGGDFVVTDGGHIDVSGGGGVTIIDGGDLNVADGGEVTLTGGGLFEWQDSQGRQRFAIQQSANYPENMEVTVRDTAGLARVLLGMMYEESTGEPSGEGILVQLADGRDVFAVRPGRTVLYGDSNVIVAADDQLSLRAETGNAFLRAGDALTMSAEGSAFLRAENQLNLTADGSASLTAGGGVSLTGENVTIRSQSNLSIGTSNDSHRLYRAGSSLYLTAPDTVGVVSADFYVWGDIGTNGDLSASGTKNFVIDHPTLPGRSLVHASTESPVAGIEYTGTATLDEDGQAVVDLPDYFEALAAPDGRTVHLTPVGRPFAVGADPVTGGAFTAYGEPGRAVSWLVKARRGDVAGQFDPEPPAPPHASPEPAPAPAAEPTVEPEPPREAPTERTT